MQRKRKIFRKKNTRTKSRGVVSGLVSVLFVALMAYVSLKFGVSSDLFSSDGNQPLRDITTPTPFPHDLAPIDSPPTDSQGQDRKLFTLLSTMPISEPMSGSGYDRKYFGRRWADVDHNGCDTRNDILWLQLENPVGQDGSCKVVSGILHDPYTGEIREFRRGEHTSPLVQIDHVVALYDAWLTGAQHLTAEERALFANDPDNLLATIGSVNQNKSHYGPDEWLPSNQDYICDYLTSYVEIKNRYGLWLTQSEYDAIRAYAPTCP